MCTEKAHIPVEMLRDGEWPFFPLQQPYVLFACWQFNWTKSKKKKKKNESGILRLHFSESHFSVRCPFQFLTCLFLVLFPAPSKAAKELQL